MPDLLKKPFGTHGKVHQITPESAGWRYVGFSLYHLRQGEAAAEATGENEVILVMVEGKAAIRAAGQDWGELGDRMDVFEKTPPHCLYVPNGQQWQAEAVTDCVIAVCSAPGHGGHRGRITVLQRSRVGDGGRRDCIQTDWVQVGQISQGGIQQRRQRGVTSRRGLRL